MNEEYGVLRLDGVNYSHDIAESVSYDNTTSGLESENVQAALDEIAGQITSGVVSGVKGNAETTYRKGDVNITPANIGLDKVGNFKAVSTESNQGLSNDEKTNARSNIGAGTSSFSGSYNDLSNKPSLATVATSGSYNDLSNKPSLATVATSGSYNDLSNKPTIPSVGNGTLTIQRNGSNVATFTANQGGNATANISVPTNTNQLTNGAGYITSSSVGNGTLTIQKNGTNVATFTANQGGNSTANITVPTKTSQLTNDSSFITSDTRVYQENSSGNADYRVLFSYNVNDNNENSASRKSNTLTYNPSSGYLHIGNAFGGIQHNGNQSMYFITSDENDYKMFLGVLNDGGLRWTLCPTSDGKIKLGLPNHKWDTIYAVVGTINTSDRKSKKDINDLDLDTIRKFIMDLNPVSYKMIDGTRTHYGMIAQDIEETMNKLGMTPLDFAGFCKDQKMEQYTEKEINEDGEEVEVEKYKPIEGEYNYGLRYDEFISPMIKVIQDQENRIESLESEVKDLKEKLSKIEALLSK